jgi:hypothetical protein
VVFHFPHTNVIKLHQIALLYVILHLSRHQKVPNVIA